MTATATVATIIFYFLGIRSQWAKLKEEQLTTDRLGFGLMVIGLIAHGFATFFILKGDQGVNLSLLSVTNFGSYLVILFISLISIRLPVVTLSFIATPLAMVIVLFATFLPQESSKQISIENPFAFSTYLPRWQHTLPYSWQPFNLFC